MAARAASFALLAALALAGCDRGPGSEPAGERGAGAVPGATGKGTSEPGGRSQPATPGVGLDGGLGQTGSGPSGAGSATTPSPNDLQGNTNRSTGSSTQR